MFNDVFAVDLHILFQNGHLTTSTTDCKLCRVMEMAKDLAIMFVVRVFRSKHRRTCAACKVVGVIFLVECNDVWSS